MDDQRTIDERLTARRGQNGRVGPHIECPQGGGDRNMGDRSTGVTLTCI